MRRSLKIFFAALLLSACDIETDSPIVDWAPVNMRICVINNHKGDLLDPANSNNILDGATLTFLEKTYSVDYSLIDKYEGAKAYLAVIKGFVLDTISVENQPDSINYCLCFGEIDGAKDYDEDIKITWGDGSSDIINYKCCDHKESKLSCKRTWKVNGNKVKANTDFFYTFSK